MRRRNCLFLRALILRYGVILDGASLTNTAMKLESSLVLQIAMGTHVGIVPYKVRPDRGTQSTATGVHISGITPLPKSNYANLRLVHGDCPKSLEDFIGGYDFGYSLVPYSGEGPWSPVFLGMRRPDGPGESLVTRYRDTDCTYMDPIYVPSKHTSCVSRPWHCLVHCDGELETIIY
ncbi:hypothetical protein BDV39DRAFT_168498 [Aspergillus sergii]|uniref:Uncharacterized protein n=1 Tax=Aspergillus sergii TaxID=1034303 RepID=A0A5N6XG74_9EURO|nr:hypothetical protein BDV39DRAFT_168498 [Aspergillus sergii]